MLVTRRLDTYLIGMRARFFLPIFTVNVEKNAKLELSTAGKDAGGTGASMCRRMRTPPKAALECGGTTPLCSRRDCVAPGAEGQENEKRKIDNPK